MMSSVTAMYNMALRTLNKNGRFPSLAPGNLFATGLPISEGCALRCDDSVDFDGEGRCEGEVG